MPSSSSPLAPKSSGSRASSRLNPLQPFQTRSIGYISASVLLERRTRECTGTIPPLRPPRGYSPPPATRRPYACSRATRTLQRSWASMPSYAARVRPRTLQSPREHEYSPMRLAAHNRPSRSRPRAIGYELLLAERLREEGPIEGYCVEDTPPLDQGRHTA